MPQTPSGPVHPGRESRLKYHPVTDAHITGGLWAERRRINREVSVPQAWDRLHEAGNYHNLELAAGRTEGDYVNNLWFLDTDIYKWLEAVAWTFQDPDLPDEVRRRLQEQGASTEELLLAVQQPDGYLDSYYQVKHPGMRFEELEWGHELYCAGHLIQAAVAWHRTTGEEGLLGIARRFADLVVGTFGTGEGRINRVGGHPEVETALVELYRETGESRYLDAARFFVERRGHGSLEAGSFGAQYFQDHAPVREAENVEGHSVRQLYLLAGVADVSAETGDEGLALAADRLFDQMTRTKTYITGGLGAHHQDEAFGDPYELPNERSYAETCAAIASIHFCYRMLALTGESKYADLLERTLYNGFLAGISLDGTKYIYANPLQVRDGHLDRGHDGDYGRVPWFHCACCPPNVMRLLASLNTYGVLTSSSEVVVHQYWSGIATAKIDGGTVRLRTETEYPWDSSVTLTVEDTDIDGEWTLSLRVPQWAPSADLRLGGEPAPGSPEGGWWRITRAWEAGDTIELILPMEPRLVVGDPRADAIRRSVALERGPLVYCVEGLDAPVSLDDLVTPPGTSVAVGPDVGLPVVTLQFEAHQRDREDRGWWPYVADTMPTGHSPAGTAVAVPYFAWGNRGRGTMRVWLPTE